MIANAYELAIQAVEELDVNEQTDLLLQNLFEEMERVEKLDKNRVWHHYHDSTHGHNALREAFEFVANEKNKNTFIDYQLSTELGVIMGCA